MKYKTFRRKISKGLAMALTVAMVLTNTDFTVLAAEPQGNGEAMSAESETEKETVSGNAADSQAVLALQERINALPTPEEFAAMADGTTVEDSTLNRVQTEVYEEAQAIAEAMDNLTEAEQAQLDTTKLEELFAYWNNQTSLLAGNIASGDGWVIASDGKLTITDASVLESNYFAPSTPPWGTYKARITSVQVSCQPTKIGAQVFYGCSNIKEINLASLTKLESIGSYAFDSNSSLTEIIFPKSLKTLDFYVFSDCTGLERVVFQSAVSIGQSVFSGCTALEEIVFPDTADTPVTIGSYAFSNCSALTELMIPESVTEIASGAFSGCSSLNAVYFLGNPSVTGSYPQTTFGADPDRMDKVTFYYKDEASNIISYLNNYADYYAAGGYGSVVFDKEEIAVPESQSTLTVVGSVSGWYTKMTNPKFSVTADNSHITASTSYNETDKTLTITLKSTDGTPLYTTFSISVEGTLAGTNVKKDNIAAGPRIAEEKTQLPAATIAQVTMSNAGETRTVLIPAGSGYDYDFSDVKVSTENTAFADFLGTVGESSFQKNPDGSYTLTLVSNRVEDAHKGETGEITLTATVKENELYKSSEVYIKVKVKKSPAAVEAAAVTATENTLTIANTNADYEYAVKAAGTTQNYSAWKTGGSEVVFDKLTPATVYVVAVREKAEGETAATLPSEVTVVTYQEKPVEAEGYTMGYPEETMTPLDGYEIRRKGEAAYTTASLTAVPGAEYEIRKAEKQETSVTIPASQAFSFILPERPETPAAVSSFTTTNNEITIKDTKAGCEYMIVAGDSAAEPTLAQWKTAEKQTAEADNAVLAFTTDSTGASLEEGTTYTIFVRKSAAEEAFASAAAKTVARTKETQSVPTEEVTSGMVENAQNTSSAVAVSCKTGYQYLLVPAGTNASDVTEAQWTSSAKAAEKDGSLWLDKTYTGETLEPGSDYQVLVRKPGDDEKMPSDAAVSEITYTKQETPAESEVLNNTTNGISLDYAEETITVHGESYEVYVPADGTTVPSHSTAATISGEKAVTSITPAIEGSKKIYVRRKGSSDGQLPASEWLPIAVNGRPETPEAVPQLPREKVTDNSITISNADKEAEYILVKKTTPATVPSKEQWENNGGSLGSTETELTLNKDNEGNPLESGQEYELIVRRKSTDNTPVSALSAPTAVKTKEKQEAPAEEVINGMVDTGKNTTSQVWVNGRAGYQYVLVPAGTDVSNVTEAQWTSNGKIPEIDGNLQLDKTYHGEAVEPGSSYQVLVRKPGDDERMPSMAVLSEATATKPAVPGSVVNTTDTSENVFGANIGNDAQQLMEKLLTEEELQQVENGNPVKIYMNVMDYSEDVSEADRNLLEQAAQGQVLLQCMDITLYKQIGENEPVKVTSTNGAITIQFNLEGDAINTNPNVVRSYEILRIHEGELSVLPCVYDAGEQIVSFETDRFSTYALAYHDTLIQVPVSGISLSAQNLTLTQAGASAQLTATVTPDNATDKTVVWTSDNTSAATVDANGVVTAVGNGTAVITATTQNGGYTASCTVTVAISDDNNNGNNNGDSNSGNNNGDNNNGNNNGDSNNGNNNGDSNNGNNGGDSNSGNNNGNNAGENTNADSEDDEEEADSTENSSIAGNANAAASGTKTGTTGTSPKTGDNSSTLFWFLLLAASAAGFAWMFRKKEKQ